MRFQKVWRRPIFIVSDLRSSDFKMIFLGVLFSTEYGYVRTTFFIESRDLAGKMCPWINCNNCIHFLHKNAMISLVSNLQKSLIFCMDRGHRMEFKFPPHLVFKLCKNSFIPSKVADSYPIMMTSYFLPIE